MSDEFDENLVADNFVVVSMAGKEDIWPAFRRLLQVAEKGE